VLDPVPEAAPIDTTGPTHDALMAAFDEAAKAGPRYTEPFLVMSEANAERFRRDLGAALRAPERYVPPPVYVEAFAAESDPLLVFDAAGNPWTVPADKSRPVRMDPDRMRDPMAFKPIPPGDAIAPDLPGGPYYAARDIAAGETLGWFHGAHFEPAECLTREPPAPVDLDTVLAEAAATGNDVVLTIRGGDGRVREEVPFAPAPKPLHWSRTDTASHAPGAIVARVRDDAWVVRVDGRELGTEPSRERGEARVERVRRGREW
jgi:hypothetical protein